MRKRFSKSEMSGFLVILFLLLLSLAAYYYSDLLFPEEESDISEITSQEKQEIEEFVGQVRQDSIKRAQRRSNKNFAEKEDIPLFPFDPNTADSATLSQLGLRGWQISNLLKYRRKGGRWRKAEDFAHLYGLDRRDFQRLAPYIRIKKTKEELKWEKEKVKKDSIFNSYPKKYPEGTILALDQVDTTELKKIPGIGSYYAQKICRYRDRLGGFLHTDQLKEIEGLPEGIEKWFVLPDKPQIKQLDINTSDFKTLVHHPYLSYEQVKAISNYIRKYGKIKNWDELSNTQIFSEEDIKRLRPYTHF